MRIAIALPVLNEEFVLRNTIGEILAVTASALPNDEVTLLIVDNASTDKTAEIGRELAQNDPRVKYVYLDVKGKGIAIRKGWESVDADIYAFMDIDLATDLEALPALVTTAANTGGIAIGSRFHPRSVVRRTPLRLFMSHGYRLVVKTLLNTKIDDAPCGFKAVCPNVVRDIMPKVEDNEWFFDTELIIRAERAGIPITPIAVKWEEQILPERASRVNVPKLTVQYLKRVLELRKTL